MGGIKLQLLCGVRTEVAVESLPYLAGLVSVQVPSLYHVLGKEGVLQTCQPLGLEAETHQGPTHIWI